MLLLIDVGNTRIKWGVPEQAGQAPACLAAVRWRHLGVLDCAALEQLLPVWQGLPVRRVLLSNVAGTLLRERLLAVLQAAFGTRAEIIWFRAMPELAGVRNGYRDPAQLGCDRFASAIGAYALFPGRALIVATCGTATTIDALTAVGQFVGGMILPGLALMARALARHTAQLPQMEVLTALATPFADNTADAIAAGCLSAQAGAIERAVREYRLLVGEEVLCVLAGGASAPLAPQLAVPCEKVDNLVLLGLHVAATQSDLSLMMALP